MRKERRYEGRAGKGRSSWKDEKALLRQKRAKIVDLLKKKE